MRFGGRRTVRDAAHRLVERRTFRSRHDPDETWRCCPCWPRTLMNKWNGREFAARHACELPGLYWAGSAHRTAPLETLPSAFVIRPVFGAMKRGVAVVADGHEILHGGPTTSSTLRERLPRSRLFHRPVPILIEEYIGRDGQPRALPLECKCHVFGGHVEAVQVIERTPSEARHRFYTPQWDPISDPMNSYLQPTERPHDAPRCLGPMLERATTLGAQLGTYMRIDFFVAGDRCLFNEFSSLPFLGQANTPHCDRAWGEVWAERLGDAV